MTGNGSGLAPLASAALATLVGRPDEARKLLRVMERQATERFVPSTSFAHVHASVGERTLAFARLEEDYRQGRALLTIKVDPLLQPLHDDPRFESLVRRLHLPWPEPEVAINADGIVRPSPVGLGASADPAGAMAGREPRRAHETVQAPCHRADDPPAARPAGATFR